MTVVRLIVIALACSLLCLAPIYCFQSRSQRNSPEVDDGAGNNGRSRANQNSGLVFAALQYLTDGLATLEESEVEDEGYLVLRSNTDFPKSHALQFGIERESGTDFEVAASETVMVEDFASGIKVPASDDESTSTSASGSASANASESTPESASGSASESTSESASGSASARTSESASGSASASTSESASGSASGSGAIDPDHLAALEEELQRMTTVSYDYHNRTETKGDWRNETWFVRVPPSQSTLDSLLTRQNGSNRTTRGIYEEDDREFVSDSHQFPGCAVVRVSTGCTAFFVSPHHALTAAHCVYSQYGGGYWRRRPTLWRGRNCNDSGVEINTRRVFSVRGHTELRMYHYDYALLETEPDSEASPCWFGIGYKTPWGNPNNFSLTTYGYPYDKRPYNNQPECSHAAMWQSQCNESYYYSTCIIHWCDVVGGNSGSPLVAKVDTAHGKNTVIFGIHTHSVYREDMYGTFTDLVWNQGPLITPLRYFQILRWMALYNEND